MRGVTISLYNKVQTGVDAFNRPVYEDVATTVDNVLIGEPTTEDVINELNLTGKHLAYTLAIPKGDTHEWNDRKVEFFGEVFRTKALVIPLVCHETLFVKRPIQSFRRLLGFQDGQTRGAVAPLVFSLFATDLVYGNLPRDPVKLMATGRQHAYALR